MKRSAKVLFALGAMWLPFSFLACNAISQLQILKGGLGEQIILPARIMSSDDQIMWIGRIFGACFAMGFLGAAFLMVGVILYLVSKLLRKIAPNAAQA
jgi:hypothetical protein